MAELKPTTKLMEHQIKSLNFMSITPRVFDLSDCGTGKTLTQIAAWALRPHHRMLVVAPKSILVPAWQRDIEKFCDGVKVAISSASNRQAAYDSGADIVVTNTDAVTWIAKNNPATLLRDFKTIVLDESEAFKNPTSARSKAMQAIIKPFQLRSLLSATPAENSLDMWHQAFLLDNGRALGTNFYKFRNRMQVLTTPPGNPFPQWADKPDAMEEIATLLAEYTIRHKLEDVIDMPELSTITYTYQLPAVQRKAYNQMKKLGMAMLQSGELIEAVNAASVSTKLRQIASGAVYKPDGTTATVDIGRYELAATLALEVQHSILFFQWTHQRDALLAVFKSLGVRVGVIDGSTSDATRNQLIEDYEKGFYRSILIHPKSGAHGITLTRATRTIWVSPVYTFSQYEQGIHRMYRNGQNKATQIVTIVAEQTIDEAVVLRQTNKALSQQSMLHLLTEYFNA